MRQQLFISGMRCAACAGKIEKSLTAIEGVTFAGVNFGNQTLTLNFEPGYISLKQIEDKIAELGFQSQPLQLSKKEWDAQHVSKDKELLAHRRKVLLCLPLASLIMFMGMGWGFFKNLDPSLSRWIQMILTLPVWLWGGSRFLTGFWRSLKTKSLTMDTLIGLGTSTAFVYSLYLSFYPQSIQTHAASWHADTGVYFDTTAFIIAFVLLGNYFEARSRLKTTGAIEKLMDLSPRFALVLRKGKESSVNVDQIIPGDILIVKPGQKIPVDGQIIEGNTLMDESMLTGESIPVEKKEGASVFAATLNKKGVIKMLAQKVGADTLLFQIIKMVFEASGTKAPIERLTDKVSALFVPSIIILSLLTAIIWMILGQPLSVAIERMVAVLIIACPCALGLATPTAIIVAMGRAAQKGFLIRNSAALELANRLDTLIFDKTGTLTMGHPQITDIITVGGFDTQTVLTRAAGLSSGSTHPLSLALTEGARERGITYESFSATEQIEGLGLKAKKGEDIFMQGSSVFLKQEGIDLTPLAASTEKLLEDGKSLIYVAQNNKLMGVVAVLDQIRPSTPAAIKELQKMKIDLLMLTGDHKKTAEMVARRSGINKIIAEVLPHQKAETIQQLLKSKKTVGMVGDGINDAPALAHASISFAMGKGSDIALENASVILINSDLGAISKMIRLSAKTVTIIKQNLFLSFFYNVAAIPIAAGLFTSFGLTLNPALAALAMAFSSVSVVSNSLRLRKA